MVYSRMDIIENEKLISNVEQAHFIMLSLYREYSKLLLQNPQDKELYVTKMQRIKHDMRYLTKAELFTKVEKLYKPTLLKLKGKTIP